MINIARKKVAKSGKQENVKFVCTDIMKYDPGLQYDILFANFVLNTFQWDDCKKVLRHLLRLVKDGGVLCIADEIKAEKTIPRLEQIIFRPFLTYVHHIWAFHPLHKIYDYRPIVEIDNFKLIEFKRDKTDYIGSWTYVNSNNRDLNIT